MLILQIETATASCSAALAENGKTIAVKELNEKNIHAGSITLFIEDVMQQAGKAMKDLDAAAVSKGPGSYTGLRIGVSTAKGLCYALDIPLIAVNTLQAMAAGMASIADFDEKAFFCPMIDARRMEVYTAVFDASGKEIMPTEAKIIDERSFSTLLPENEMIFFGDGAAKCQPVLGHHPNAVVVPDFVNSASYLSLPAYNKFLKRDFEDTAYFEPFYLKDFLIRKV